MSKLNREVSGKIRNMLLPALIAFVASEFIAEQLKTRAYQTIVLTGFPDTKFQNREEPDQHLFSTSKNAPPVVVYELKR